MVHIFQSNRPRQLLLDKTLSPSRSRGHAIIIMTIIITHTRLYGLKPVGWDTKTNNVNELKKTRDVFTPFTHVKSAQHIKMRNALKLLELGMVPRWMCVCPLTLLNRSQIGKIIFLNFYVYLFALQQVVYSLVLA